MMQFNEGLTPASQLKETFSTVKHFIAKTLEYKAVKN